MLLWLLLVVCQGEHFYLDGVTFFLKDGTEIRTVAEIRENQLEYVWYEGHVEINLFKRDVASMEYFSMRVKGRRPYKEYKNAAMSRISGRPVAYSRDGQTYLKCRHIDFRGRPAEGRSNASQIKELHVGEPVDGVRTLTAQFARVVKDSLLTIRFYDLKGARLYETHADADALAVDDRGRKPATFQFTLPARFDPNQIGLVEVVTVPHASQ